MLANRDIRMKAKEKSVTLWEIADKLNISEPTMTRKLRRELSDTEKAELITLIDTIAAEKKAIAV